MVTMVEQPSQNNFGSMGGGKYHQKALAPPGGETIELRDYTMPFIV